jgi:hypothetical protein
VAFPYSPAFHLLAWPVGVLLGDDRAIVLVGVLAVTATLALVGVLGTALGLPALAVLLAQGLVALSPVTSSRLTLALYPTLLGQALELLLAVHLVRRFGHLDGARDAGAAALVLLLVQSAYTGSLINVTTLVLVFCVVQAALGEARRALRLLTAWAVAAGLAAAMLYLRFLPTLLREVLPHAASGALDVPVGTLGGPLARLTHFFGFALLLLGLAGLGALRQPSGRARHAARWLVAVLLAGLLLSLGRYALPGLLRDAKDVELLTAPLALAGALALARFARRGRGGVGAGLAIALMLLVRGALAAGEAYAARFFAVR